MPVESVSIVLVVSVQAIADMLIMMPSILPQVKIYCHLATKDVLPPPEKPANVRNSAGYPSLFLILKFSGFLVYPGSFDYIQPVCSSILEVLTTSSQYAVAVAAVMLERVATSASGISQWKEV